MKKIIFFILVISCAFNLRAQDFKDVFESLPFNDRFSNMIDLQNYQSENPEHAISYFLLGEIYDEYMREIDPILMFNILESNYHQLKTYYGLLSYNLDEKQARQDRDYFGTIEITTDKKKVGLPDILLEVGKRMKAATLYYENAKSVHDNYYRCINKYNNCLYSYRELLESFPAYKTLYLLTTPKLRNQIETIALDFDSSLVYFESYHKSSINFPHLLKVNTYHLNPITTYRLEGLIESDFTDPVVELWDYKTWAKYFLNLLNTDILEIREGLIETDRALNSQIEKFKTESIYSDEPVYYRVDDKFQNLIGKYDHHSLSNELINYKKSKIKYLLESRSEENDLNNNNPFFLINKLRFFRELAFSNSNLNEEATLLKQSISIGDIGKNIDFYQKQFNGMDGFMRWCEIEKYDNSNWFDENLIHLREFISRDANKYNFADSLLSFKNKIIPFEVQSLDSIYPDTILTTGIYSFKRRWHYLNGFELNKDSVSKAFFAQVNPNGKVNWMKNLVLKGSSSDANTTIFKVQILDDSTSYVLATSNQQNSDNGYDQKTFVSKYNWKGKEQYQKVIDTLLTPVYFEYDEINEQYLLISQSTITDTLGSNYPMCVRLFNANDSLIWENKFNLDGQVIDVITTNSNFYITCNYKQLEYNKSNISLKEETNSIAGIYIQQNGAVNHINEYKINGELWSTNLFKITNSSLNIMGEYQMKGEDNKQLFYLLVDDQGQVLFSNYKQLAYNINRLLDL